MEEREDLRSILPWLPLIARSGNIFWAPQALEDLRALSRGPESSGVDSGEALSDFISGIRGSIGLSRERLAFNAAGGYALFFDDLMSSVASRELFGDTVPALANLLLRLPTLLEWHYLESDRVFGDVGEGAVIRTGLRILQPQEAGIVFLSQVLHSGFIEDQQYEALEVDFANEYLGGGALHRGCVQEEIRFMINPELIAGMFFLPCMESNEAIEIVGAERFANYTGYASSFRFMGDFMDKKSLDSLGRRKTRIVAIDALCNPRTRQYKSKNLIRETNKAFCGFLYHAKHQSYLKDPPQFACANIGSGPGNESMDYEAQDNCHIGYTSLTITENCRAQKSLCSISGSEENSIFIESLLHVENEREPTVDALENSRHGDRAGSITEINIGIATGNWGCGAFGGDPELKCMIQWLSASQALRPFVLYYTFGEAALQRLEEVSSWILSHNWTVGDLWSILNEYSSKRLNGETDIGFFSWLLPSVQEENHSINTVEEMMSE
ncbi:Poly(ADP-ribose) glycohydrolase 1 [Acorus calamus]|uniref:Poly(ADP-ribose) glycohydrolase 1 n=1 Tax=Acorus calamus TaxID=4465 RepID=A0AAV9D0Y5_ACOCL|nr:Poly(ADP-ribose) glycohydrolase 1 [Acorus calamus]